MATRVETGAGWELRCGDCRDVLDGVACAAVIADPPYSQRTHSAQRSDFAARQRGFKELPYAHWTDADVERLAGFCALVDAGWVVAFSDHVLRPDYERNLQSLGFYVFAPIPQVTMNRSVRLAGDGPACWTTWITAARKRNTEFRKWGALPGAYVDSVGDREPGVVVGAKQLHTMRSVVRDYSKPGSLVCDPCAGGATTLLAAVTEGRRAIGAEIDEETFDKAVRRLRRGYTPDMFTEAAA